MIDYVYDLCVFTLRVWGEIGDVLHGLGEDRIWTSYPVYVLVMLGYWLRWYSSYAYLWKCWYSSYAYLLKCGYSSYAYLLKCGYSLYAYLLRCWYSLYAYLLWNGKCLIWVIVSCKLLARFWAVVVNWEFDKKWKMKWYMGTVVL